MTQTRRETLAWLAGTALASLGFSFRPRAATDTQPVLVRPPGALPPATFEATCIRCFRCAEVCPPHAIRFNAAFSPDVADTPFLTVQERACTLCMRCTDACPTGALQKTAPDLVTIAAAVRMGKANLDHDKCLAWQRKQPCHLCVDVCPLPHVAIHLEGARKVPVIDPGCIGCGLCAEACPDRAKAIDVVPAATKVMRT